MAKTSEHMVTIYQLPTARFETESSSREDLARYYGRLAIPARKANKSVRLCHCTNMNVPWFFILIMPFSIRPY